jgi:hypothetical protein
MSFSEEAKQEIRRIFHDELSKFVQYQLDGLKPLNIATHTPLPQPQLQVKLPAQIANENTAAKDGLVCACGKPKKSGYNQCYDCYLKRVNK